jgi:autotransporter-associated beta strand protein
VATNPRDGGSSGAPTSKAGGAGNTGTKGGGGGGGGAGAAGSAGTDPNGGNGGAGVANGITGTSTSYGGGGGGAYGGSGTNGQGGTGGGGDGAAYLPGPDNFLGQPGTANTGGGGGGGRGNENNGGAGGAGGSGVAIIQFYGDNAAAVGGTLGTISAGNGNYYRRFTASSTLSGLTVPASQLAIFSGNLSGATATLAKDGAGTLILTGNNNYGVTTITAGTLQIGDDTSTGSLGVGNVLNNATLAFNRTGSISVSNAISGNGSLKQVGTGTLTLTGINIYTGATTVSNGTLLVNGTLVSAVTIPSAGRLGGTGTLNGAVTVNGTLAPGISAGTLTIRNNLILTGGATLRYELGATSDRVNIVGNLTLDGTLHITATAGFGPGTYTLITYTGTLTNNGLVVGTTPNPSYQYQLDTSVAGQVRLMVSATIASWQMQYFGCTTCPQAALTADPDGDGLANLIERALGLDPTVAGVNPILFDREAIDTNTYLRLSVTRDPAVTDVLIEGLSAGTLSDSNAWSTTTTVIESNTPSFFRVRDALPIETNSHRFLKLRFSMP